MPDIEDFVQVNITRETRALSVKSFGTPMLLDHHTHYLDRVREYEQADDLLDDGWSTNDALYLRALAVKSQNPSPQSFKVGRRANADQQIVHIIPHDLTEGLVHTITIDGVNYSVENPVGATAGTVTDEIVNVLTGVSGVGVTDAATHATATATAAGDVHRFRVSEGLRLLDATADSGVVADLAAIEAADPNWYGLALDNYSQAVIASAAVWVEARAKIMGLQSTDWTVRDAATTTDIASALAAAAYTRMWGTWHGEIGGIFAAAWIAKILAVNPGRENPAHQTLPGQTVDTFTSTQRTAVRNKRWSTYEETSGFNHTFEGKTPSNEYIDQIIGSDWLKFRMQEEVFLVYANASIVPQTNTGIAMHETAVWSILKQGSGQNFPILDPESLSVEVPDISEVPMADRLARTLTGISWSGRFQGAFNRAKPINGTVSV